MIIMSIEYLICENKKTTVGIFFCKDNIYFYKIF